MSGYSLKAACSCCGSYGTVDDTTLVCCRCSGTHDLSDAQRDARDAEIAFVDSYQTARSTGLNEINQSYDDGGHA